MNRIQTVSKKLVEALSLEYLPVAVRLLRKGEPVPTGFERPEKAFPSFCSAVVAAGNGKSLYLEGKDMRCSDANVVLGLAEKGEGMDDEGKPPLGIIKGVTVSPLDASPTEPDTVLMYIDPEQASKLLQAVTYDIRYTGGKKRIPAYAVGGEVVLCPSHVMAKSKLESKPYIGIVGRWSNLDFLSDKLVLGIPYTTLAKGCENLAKVLPIPLKRAQEKHPL